MYENSPNHYNKNQIMNVIIQITLNYKQNECKMLYLRNCFAWTHMCFKKDSNQNCEILEIVSKNESLWKYLVAMYCQQEIGRTSSLAATWLGWFWRKC